MTNTSGRIGREGEHKTIELLHQAGFENLIREGKRAKQLDIISDPEVVRPIERVRFPIESRRRKRIDLQEWVRSLTAQYGKVWSLFIHPRDARLKDAMPPVVVLPAELGAKLLLMFHEEQTLEAIYADSSWVDSE